MQLCGCPTRPQENLPAIMTAKLNLHLGHAAISTVRPLLSKRLAWLCTDKCPGCMPPPNSANEASAGKVSRNLGTGPESAIREGDHVGQVLTQFIILLEHEPLHFDRRFLFTVGSDRFLQTASDNINGAPAQDDAFR
jgi:hypothetical protein